MRHCRARAPSRSCSAVALQCVQGLVGLRLPVRLKRPIRWIKRAWPPIHRRQQIADDEILEPALTVLALKSACPEEAIAGAGATAANKDWL